MLSYTSDFNAQYDLAEASSNTDLSRLPPDVFSPAQPGVSSPRKRQKTSFVVLCGRFDLSSADLPSNIQLTGHLEWEKLQGPQHNLRHSALFPHQSATLLKSHQPLKEKPTTFQIHDKQSPAIHPRGTSGPSLDQLESTARETTHRDFQASSRPLLSLATNSTTLDQETLDFSSLLPPAYLFKEEHDKAAIIPPDSPKTETPSKPEATHRNQVSQGASPGRCTNRVFFHSKTQVRFFVPPLEAAGIKSPENRKRARGVITHRYGALTYNRLYVWITGDKKKNADRARRLIQTASLEDLAVIFKKGALQSWELEKAFLLLVMGDFLSNPACLANTLCLHDLPHEKEELCLKKLLGLVPLDGTEKWARKRKRRAC